MNFCLPLAKELLLKNVKRGFSDNVLVSPLSLNAVVVALAAGCSGRSLDRVLNFAQSKSLDQLKSKFSESIMSIVPTSCHGKRGPKVSYGNGVWVDKRFPLKPSYQQCLRDTFKAEVRNHDFKTQADAGVRAINSWAKLQTNGLIKSVIEPHQIHPLTAIIFVNALYFKGTWNDKFDPRWTEERDFYLLNGDKISVPFMTSSRSYLYGSFDDFKVVEIPYQTFDDFKVVEIPRWKREGKPKFSMKLILPHEKDGLPSLVEKLIADSGCFNGYLDGLRMTELDPFWIPKFKFSYTLDNIKFPFMDDDEPMELTEMLQLRQGETPLISNMVQKAFIQVDEEGTEAAAVTCFEGEGSCIQQEPVHENFVADHPFIFIIKEEASGSVLFVGAVLKP